MERKYFVICVFFSLWTIVQTALHLFFVMYTYFMGICLKSPTESTTIFFYLTYLYNSHCKTPKLTDPSTSLISIEQYVAYIYKTVYFSSTNESSLQAIVKELLDKIDLFPEYAPAAQKTTFFLLSFMVLDGVWIISAVALLMGACVQIKQSSALFFYTPWLMMTACISFFDAAGTILFGMDIAETTNFSNWVKFIGIEQASEFADLDSKNFSTFYPIAPTIYFCSVSSRFIIIWLINWVGFFYVVKATKSVYKEKYKTPARPPRPQLFTDTSPPRSQMDLNSSAARIRSWQLFYGAIDTTSSRSSKHSDRDVNSNSRETGESMPTVSENVSSFHYSYPDVEENVESGEHIPLELRGQLPWSYIPTGEGTGKTIEPARLRIKSTDSSGSGTDL